MWTHRIEIDYFVIIKTLQLASFGDILHSGLRKKIKKLSKQIWGSQRAEPMPKPDWGYGHQRPQRASAAPCDATKGHFPELCAQVL